MDVRIIAFSRKTHKLSWVSQFDTAKENLRYNLANDDTRHPRVSSSQIKSSYAILSDPERDIHPLKTKYFMCCKIPNVSSSCPFTHGEINDLDVKYEMFIEFSPASLENSPQSDVGGEELTLSTVDRKNLLSSLLHRQTKTAAYRTFCLKGFNKETGAFEWQVPYGVTNMSDEEILEYGFRAVEAPDIPVSELKNDTISYILGDKPLLKSLGSMAAVELDFWRSKYIVSMAFRSL